MKPSKCLLVMKLTTPPTASEPYDAEAPPVTTSTRSISNCGNRLMSGTPVTLAPTTRCPSSSVSVRIVPSPRSEKELSPCCPLEVELTLVEVLAEPCSDGSCATVVKILGSAFLAIESAVSTWVGVGAVKPLVRMREPVTTMSRAASSDAVDGAGGDWARGGADAAVWPAQAGAATVIAISAAPVASVRRRPRRVSNVVAIRSMLHLPLMC